MIKRGWSEVERLARNAYLRHYVWQLKNHYEYIYIYTHGGVYGYLEQWNCTTHLVVHAGSARAVHPHRTWLHVWQHVINSDVPFL